MKTKKEVKIKKYRNTAFDDGYFNTDECVKEGTYDPSEIMYNTFSDRTGALSSTNIIIKSNGKAVGAIQKFDFNESNGTIFGQCIRIHFFNENILEAFTGQPHIEPVKKFDIEIFYQYPGEERIWDGYEAYSGPCVVLSGVEITHRRTCFDVEKFVVVEDISFTAEKIHTIVKKK